MTDLYQYNTQIKTVDNFHDLVSIPFAGKNNAMCWARTLEGDFAEIVNKLIQDENIIEVTEDDLAMIQLSEAGDKARIILLNDMKLLRENGSLPSLNIIKYYDRDDALPSFATDVYSYHVDRSPIPTYTYLCTYYGDASDIIPNEQAIQKVLIPEIRAELIEHYDGDDEGFEEFLEEYFYDLHYQALPDAQPINLGIGNLWRLAIDHPDSPVLPCIHQAPVEVSGVARLMLIC
jgi:hypothetical protein